MATQAERDKAAGRDGKGGVDDRIKNGAAVANTAAKNDTNTPKSK